MTRDGPDEKMAPPLRPAEFDLKLGDLNMLEQTPGDNEEQMRDNQDNHTGRVRQGKAG